MCDRCCACLGVVPATRSAPLVLVVVHSILTGAGRALAYQPGLRARQGVPQGSSARTFPLYHLPGTGGIHGAGIKPAQWLRFKEFEMKSVHTVTRRLLFAGSLAALVGVGVAGPAIRPAMAHEGKCPVCKLDVPQDTDKQDNEVALKSGRKRIEYRCVYCALSDAKSYTGDITILAPSDVQGKPVMLMRKSGNWSSMPENAVFVGQKVNHRSCQLGYRAFTNKTAFDAWVHKNHELLSDARPLTLKEMVDVASGK